MAVKQLHFLYPIIRLLNITSTAYWPTYYSGSTIYFYIRLGPSTFIFCTTKMLKFFYWGTEFNKWKCPKGLLLIISKNNIYI